MPRRRVSRRNNRRNHSRRNRTSAFGILRRRVQNISNRPTLRPRKSGFSNIALNSTRRLFAYPSSGVAPNPSDPTPKSSWWLDTLKWGASLALQLLGIWITGAENDEVKKFVITGAGTTFGIDAITVLSYSPLACRTDNKINFPFEQFRIVWIRATITPVVDVSRRGGSYVAAMVPMARSGFLSDVSHEYDMLMRQPGSVIRPIDKPCSVSWSPNLLENGLQWSDIGDTGTHYICALAISFSDLALNAADKAGTSATEYCPAKAGFEIVLESRVEVRRPGWTSRPDDLHYSDPTLIQISEYNRQTLIPFSAVQWYDGFGQIPKSHLIEVLSPESDFDDLAAY